jgi:gluconate kinase
MKIASMLLIAFLAWLSAATWTSQASPAGRDEAISSCTAQAKKQYRQRGRGTAEHRTYLYMACMRSAGFPP